jgi:hypothetical protein
MEGEPVKLTIELELGDDALQYYSEALAAISASFVRYIRPGSLATTLVEDGDSYPIRDADGNTVGKWEAV